jgi:hypothetical protein
LANFNFRNLSRAEKAEFNRLLPRRRGGTAQQSRAELGEQSRAEQRVNEINLVTWVTGLPEVKVPYNCTDVMVVSGRVGNRKR